MRYTRTATQATPSSESSRQRYSKNCYAQPRDSVTAIHKAESIFRHDAAKAIFPLCTVNGWAFDFEALMIAEKLGYTIREYPVKVINHRESKINLMRDTFKMIRDVKEIKKRVDAM